MVLDPRVIYRENGVPHLVTMLTLSSDFIVVDAERGLTAEQLDLKYIFPVLRQFASVCNNYAYLVAASPGRTEQSSNGDAVGYKQVLFDGGVIPVLLRIEYEPKTSGTLVTISIKVGVAK